MSPPKLTKSRRKQLEKVYGSAAIQAMSQSVLRKLAQTEVAIAKAWRPARPEPVANGHNGAVVAPIELAESFKQVIVDNGQRQREWLEKAITHAALDLQVETEPLASALDHAIKVWNSHADEIDKMFGEKGFFGVRLARLNAASFRFEVLQRKPRGIFVPIRKSTPPTDGMARAGFLLDYLQATDAKPVYGWMADLLFMSLQSEENLQHQARARDGFWNRVLRKRKSAMAVKRMALQHEAAMVEKEVEEHQRRERFGTRHLMATGKWAQVASRTKYDDPATE